MPLSPRARISVLLKRLGAMLYDALLLVALYMGLTFAMLPLTGGEAITPQTHPVLEHLYRLALLAITAGFFGLSWTRRGQTLGMQSWRLKLVREDGALPRWRDALLRLSAAVLSWLPLGLGFLWILVDAEGRSWHDRLSRTRVVELARSSSRS
jgi:uncharacterized RDD family membrane protein YckC